MVIKIYFPIVIEQKKKFLIATINETTSAEFFLQSAIFFISNFKAISTIKIFLSQFLFDIVTIFYKVKKIWVTTVTKSILFLGKYNAAFTNIITTFLLFLALLPK